jgi:hypothetical protein
MREFSAFLAPRLAHMNFCNRPGDIFGGQKRISAGRRMKAEGVKDETGTAAFIG